VTQPDRSPSPVDQLADQFWDDILELNPTTATVYGDERFNDRLEDPSPAGRARARDLMVRTLTEAGIPPAPVEGSFFVWWPLPPGVTPESLIA